MPLTPQMNDFLSCPICFNCFSANRRPITLTCSHTCCSSCLKSLQCCPFDQTVINSNLPENEAIIGLILNTSVSGHHINDSYHREINASNHNDYGIESDHLQHYYDAINCIKQLAHLLKPQQQCSSLSRPMQRKLISLLHCQIIDGEGRARAMRNARSIGERALAEILIKHQDSHQLSSNLWAAVRARGCQFLGPAMQEEVLRLVLLALEDGSALSRKVLVMFVVQRLSPHFPHQASKTAIGHVIQLLYRASCFKLTKRDGDSSLMQLKEEYCSYEALRREHDTQIVSIALEAGLRISPDQWSSLLYGDTVHKSHMQSIIDKLQSPASFSQSVQELIIALQRTGDPANLTPMKQSLEKLALIDPSPVNHESLMYPTLEVLSDALESAKTVTFRLIDFLQKNGISHSPHGSVSTPRSGRFGSNSSNNQKPRIGRVKPLMQQSTSPQQNQFSPIAVMASPSRGTFQRPCASVPPSRIIGTTNLIASPAYRLPMGGDSLQNSKPIPLTVGAAVPAILVGANGPNTPSNTPILASPVIQTGAVPAPSLPSEDDQFIPFDDQPFVSKYGPISRLMGLINTPMGATNNAMVAAGMTQQCINNLARTTPTNVILGRTAVPSLTVIQPLQQLVLTTTTILTDHSNPQFGNTTFVTETQNFVNSDPQ